MLISKQWLHDFVFLPDSLLPHELAKDLTLHTVEVEGCSTQNDLLEHVVIGQVRSIAKHKDADKLQVCQVFDGQHEIQIVCGGTNVVKGMKVALGTIGAKVKWHGEGEPVELKKTKIRGEDSFGMICAAEEIGLGELFPNGGDTEILDLSHLEDVPGVPVAEALGANNVIIDIDNKSMTHRPDLWGHYGMAREVAAMYRKQFKMINPAVIKEGTEINIKANIASEGCRRYQAVALDGITIEPSPEWLKKRLLSIGVNPINNIVDITNYVMFELGQPMHAFDIDAFQKNKKEIEINIREATQNETLTTLDGVERILDAKTMVIANQKTPIAIAGIMGGKDSEVYKDTNSIIIECANFDSIVIRKTSQMLGLRTEASTRFEKTLDPTLTDLALRRCIALIRSLNQEARVISNVFDSGKVALNQGPIHISLKYITQKIGADISQKTVIDILERLGFVIKIKKEELVITIPTWRATKDIAIAEDIIEEVARMYGYENIETVLPTVPMYPAPIHPLEKLKQQTQNILAHTLGYSEVMTYSFVSVEDVKKMGTSNQERLELDNPVAKDRPLLRRYLSTNLVQIVEKNNHRFDEVALFEIGKVFIPEEVGERAEINSDELLPKQPTMLGLVYSAKQQDTPYREVSDALTHLLTTLGYTYTIHKNKEVSFGHPGRTASIEVEGVTIAWISELHPKVQQTIGIDSRVGIAELNLDLLRSIPNNHQAFEPIALYPSIQRDIAFVIDKTIAHTDILKAINTVDPLIVDVQLFDVYIGQHVKQDHKSVGYRILYLDKEKTLTSSTVDDVQKKVIDMLTKQFAIEIR